MSMQTFGAWQGGPFSRYSPVGIGNIAKECFGGMQHDLTEVESSDGKRRLAQVVQILCKFIEWVNSLSRRITVTALPVPFLREKMLETCAAIKDVVPSIEFKVFRLGIFLTHANGCRLTQSGIHLRNLFFPATGMASCKHLKEARGDIMEYDLSMSLAHVGRKRKRNEVADDDHATDTSGQDISEDNFDEAMKAVSEQFGGATFVRDTWEVAICESKSCRELELVDSFIRGIPLYDINHQGKIVRKEPGRDSRWTVYHPMERERTYKILEQGAGKTAN
eukprot:scaffold13668_cov91-Cylindrotheca_fusiformis.AAC.1